MTKGFFTQTELINLKILNDSLLLNSDRIKDIINDHLKSDARRAMALGEDYYLCKHDILNFRPYYFLDGQKILDPVKSNITIPHPFHKILVDQKMAYMVGSPVVVSIGQDDKQVSEAESDDLNSTLMDVLGDEFDDIMNDWVKAASNQAVGWIHFYIDGEGVIQYLVCDARELIPVYDTQYQKDLVGMIRYYEVVNVMENSSLMKSNKRYNVEWWTDTNVTYYTQLDDLTFVPDPEHIPNPSGHWMTFNTIDPINTADQQSWERVPFVPLYNNSQQQTDLEPVKILIDAYDKVKSGWVNDLVDFQELIYVIKGYSALTSKAQSGMSELAIFLQNLKTNKVISVEEDGGVDTLKAEIPIEAKDKFLDITRKEIFYFGQGVDTSNEAFGTAPSGVSLKFLYSLLDMKANTLIRKMNTSLGKFFYFICHYLESAENKTIDPAALVYTFNKAVIFNEKEKVEMLDKSGGALLSQQTLLENHPLVTDVVEEQARLDLEKKEREKQALIDLANAPVPDPNVDPDGEQTFDADGNPIKKTITA